MIDRLLTISPIDGRYRDRLDKLADYFSEYALIRYRLHVEVAYFIALCQAGLPQLKTIGESSWENVRAIARNFDLAQAKRVKDIEARTNHDVKALEYFLKEEMGKLPAFAGANKSLLEFVHFGLTSQDINNTAIPMMIRDSIRQVYLPLVERLVLQLTELAARWRNVPMLAHTHGQPASPTVLGKEVYVFIERLEKQRVALEALPYPAKFGGATGNFNAHMAAYPDVDWVTFANRFVNEILGLDRSQTTTQIEHYDGLAALFDALRRINVILIDLCRDCWTYISMGYFQQSIKAGEVGSSAMPHKVNPIDFENAEGNLGFANAIFDHLSNKLPVSRLQRDLTDSTVLRNVGVPIAHTVLSIKSLMKGLEKIEVNKPVLEADLEDNWAVIAEAIQTVLRREGYPEPYEALKELTRVPRKLDKATMQQFVESLNVNATVKAELLKLTPHNYTGNA